MTWVGVDRAAGRWAWVSIEVSGSVAAGLVDRLDELPAGSVVAIDMPLGFPEPGERRVCEVEARRLLGPRRSTIFETFPRWVYEGRSYDAALRAECRRVLGRVPSAQAHALGSSILEAVGAATDTWVETHPELAFMARAGEVLPPKTRWDGVRSRLAVLHAEGIDPPPLPAATDDVLDAAVCAAVARAHARGDSRFVGSSPDTIAY